MSSELALIAVGFAAGMLGALLGVGGGVILVPGLLFVTGLSFHAAVGTSLVCVVATSVAASVVYLRRGQVELELAVELQLYTVFGAVAAGLLAARIPAGPLYLAFATLLATMAYRMWPRRRVATPVRHGRSAGAAVGAASVGAGALAGLLGVGGGILNVPILHLLVGLAFERAVATSVHIIGVTAAAAGLVYLARGDVDPAIAGVVLLGTLAGAGLAAVLGGRIRPHTLQLGFALLLLYVAYRMAVRGIAAL